MSAEPVFPPSTLERAEKLWLMLSEMYGQAHYDLNGEQPGRLWLQDCIKYSDDQLKAGLERLADDGLPYAANYSQFVKAMKRKPPVRYLGSDTASVPRIGSNTPEAAREAICQKIETYTTLGNTARVLELTEQLEDME